MRAISEVLPPESLARYTDLNLVARWIVEGFIAGLHHAPFQGFSSEYTEYRPYAAGDDLKQFDWKALGRSGRKYVKQFQSETNVPAYILLDCSVSMKSGDPVSKFQYSRAIAAALSYLMITQRDATGAILFADEILGFVPPKSSPRHFREIVSVLTNADVRDTANAHSALHRLAEKIKRRGLFIVISDLSDDKAKIVSALRHLLFNKNEVLVFHVIDHAAAKLPQALHAEFRGMDMGERIKAMPAAMRSAYMEAIGGLSDDMRRQCADMDIGYQMIDTRTPFEKVLARYVDKRTRVG